MVRSQMVKTASDMKISETQLSTNGNTEETDLNIAVIYYHINTQRASEDGRTTSPDQYSVENAYTFCPGATCRQ